MRKQDLYINQIFLNETELMPDNIKVQVLNTIKAKIDKVQSDASTQMTAHLALPILSSLETLMLIVEDAYNISMYKFQFKLITNSLNKELKNLEDMVTYA
jgi:hypothetical protein